MGGLAQAICETHFLFQQARYVCLEIDRAAYYVWWVEIGHLNSIPEHPTPG